MTRFLSALFLLVIQINFYVHPCKSSIKVLEEEKVATLSSSNLTALPTELLGIVIDYLDDPGLLTSRMVCKELKMNVDSYCKQLPQDDKELEQLIDKEVGKIPAKLGIFITIPLLEGERQQIADRFLGIANRSYTAHYNFNTLEQRALSHHRWDRYRVLLCLADQLGHQTPLGLLQHALEVKRDELRCFNNDPFPCTVPPYIPEENYEKILRAFWMEQIASCDASE